MKVCDACNSHRRLRLCITLHLHCEWRRPSSETVPRQIAFEDIHLLRVSAKLEAWSTWLNICFGGTVTSSLLKCCARFLRTVAIYYNWTVYEFQPANGRSFSEMHAGVIAQESWGFAQPRQLRVLKAMEVMIFLLAEKFRSRAASTLRKTRVKGLVLPWFFIFVDPTVTFAIAVI